MTNNPESDVTASLVDLEPMRLEKCRHDHPDRFEKVDLAGDQLHAMGAGEFVVSREESEAAHACRLVHDEHGDLFGACTCAGFRKWNSQPCSHLCGVYRAKRMGLLDVPEARVLSVTAEPLGDVEDGQERLVTDGGPAATSPCTDCGVTPVPESSGFNTCGDCYQAQADAISRDETRRGIDGRRRL